TSACEPFTVKAPTTVTTTVIDEAISAAWSGSEKTGASAHDTATVGGQGATPATGTITYSLFSNGSCTAPATSSQPVTLNANGTVPNSSSTGALAAGSYSFRASYGGDTGYAASTASCEAFSVAVAATTVTTTVIDNLTGLTWSNTEVPGSTAHDTAVIGGQQPGVAASGTVTYSFFTNGSCTTPASTTQTVIVTSA